MLVSESQKLYLRGNTVIIYEYLFKYMSPLVVTSAGNQNSKILETTDWSPEKRKVFNGHKKLLEPECFTLKWEWNETNNNTPQQVLTGSDFPI